jgi:predicted secreted hydrolase
MSVSVVVKALSLFVLLALPALAQGFAGLGGDAEGFSVPKPGVPLEFPKDHGAHPDFRIEWWYITANLQGANGQDYGVQWTLFRNALEPVERSGWSSPQLWMGHGALTSKDQHLVAERVSRGGIGQAGVTREPFAAWIDDWRMESRAAPGEDQLSALKLSAAGQSFSYELSLVATAPIVPQGDEGYSVKSLEGQASYYYSQPFYQVTGTISLPEGKIEVKGQGWLDREWSSQPLAAGQTGWDWFSFHFESGEKLMGYVLRDASGSYRSATWIGADGKPEPQIPGALVVSSLETAEIAGRSLPVRWRVRLASKGLDVTTQPLNRNAWMDTSVPYWEGPVRFRGSHKGKGYIEMTGYK